MGRIWSYGIILCKFNPFPTILFVKKRFTYALLELLTRKNKNPMLLLNKMTSQEKFIVTCGFDSAWKYVYGEIIETKKYIRCKRSYEHMLLNKNFDKMVKNSKNVDTLWEIPKGRRKNLEKPLDAAIRETFEETQISPQQYQLIPVKPIKITYNDTGYDYGEKYYIAVMKADLGTDVKYKEDISLESNLRRWMTRFDWTMFDKSTCNYWRMYYIFTKMKKMKDIISRYRL